MEIMIKNIGCYIIGFILVVFFGQNFIVFLNSNILNATLESTQVNDYFQLWVRISISYIFGVAYFLFKVQRNKIDLRLKQAFFSVLGLLFLILLIDFLQIIFILKVLGNERFYIVSI